jgi:hypothetical protein
MSEYRDDSVREPEALTPEMGEARSALRALPTAAPRAAFRAKLREEFVSGLIESSAPPRTLVIPWYRTSMARWGATAMAAAAALLIVSVMNQAPAWKLGDVHGDGIVVVDGVPVPTQHLSDLERRLKPGVFVQVPDGVDFELASAGQLAMQFTSGTQASVPNPPGRWFQRQALAEVRTGEVRITTGREFHGARLALETPEARVEVTGTTLAVICEPAGTCVCVMDGRVMVGTRGGAGMTAIDAGHRRYLFSDGRPDESADMRPTEHAELPRFQQRMHAMMMK